VRKSVVEEAVFVVVFCEKKELYLQDVWTRKGRQGEGKGEEPFVESRSAVPRGPNPPSAP
jgi:hypothetical protein